LSQIEHLLQTAEAIRRDGKPEWMQVTGLIHDLGKLLFLFDSEGQWDVVGVRKYLYSPISDSELGILIVVFSPSRTHLSSDAAFRTKSYIQRHSRQTRTPTTRFIRQNTVSTNPIAVSIMSCSHGATMRSVLIICQKSSERIIDTWAQYLYHVLKGQCSLPEEGLAMIRYHSFYP
jgi:inositol oxygenase